MAQRESGYRRKERDAYMTPAWVTDVLVDELERRRLLPRTKRVQDPTMASRRYTIDTGQPLGLWECAAGTGQMAGALASRGYEVFSTDIAPDAHSSQHDFTLRERPLLMPEIGAIVTNPPYDQAEQFVANALDLMQPSGGLVAMLLKVDWDSAKSRRRYFAGCPAWALKLVLNDRVTWFDPVIVDGKVSAGPSENHAWFVWDWAGAPHHGATVAYATAPPSVQADLRRKRGALKALLQARPEPCLAPADTPSASRPAGAVPSRVPAGSASAESVRASNNAPRPAAGSPEGSRRTQTNKDRAA